MQNYLYNPCTAYLFINSEKLLLLLGIPARHKGEPVKHEDVTVIGMKVGKAFNGDDIKQEIEEATTKAGHTIAVLVCFWGTNVLIFSKN